MLLYDVYSKGNTFDNDIPLRDAQPWHIVTHCTNGDGHWLINASGTWVQMESESAIKILEACRHAHVD